MRAPLGELCASLSRSELGGVGAALGSCAGPADSAWRLLGGVGDYCDAVAARLHVCGQVGTGGRWWRPGRSSARRGRRRGSAGAAWDRSCAGVAGAAEDRRSISAGGDGVEKGAGVVGDAGGSAPDGRCWMSRFSAGPGGAATPSMLQPAAEERPETGAEPEPPPADGTWWPAVTEGQLTTLAGTPECSQPSTGSRP